MTQTTNRLDALIKRLKDNGHRLTPQRLAIVSALANSSAHPTAEQIHKMILKDFPTTSLATVYKTITMLKEQGEIIELSFGDMGSRFDARDAAPHPHIICTRCGSVFDLDVEEAFESVDFNVLATRMADKTGFRIESYRLDFYGICSKCQDK